MTTEGIIAATFMILSGAFVVGAMAHKKITNKDQFDFAPSHLFNAFGCISILCGLSYFFPFVLEAIISAIAIAFFSFACYSIFKTCMKYKEKNQNENEE